MKALSINEIKFGFKHLKPKTEEEMEATFQRKLNKFNKLHSRISKKQALHNIISKHFNSDIHSVERDIMLNMTDEEFNDICARVFKKYYDIDKQKTINTLYF